MLDSDEQWLFASILLGIYTTISVVCLDGSVQSDPLKWIQIDFGFQKMDPNSSN